MSDEITIEIQESPPVNITLDDGCEVQVSINGSVSSVYWQDVLNKPDFDALYYPITNPSGYVTGQVVRPSETGIFYLASNPSGFISGAVVRPDTYILRDSNSLQSVNWQTRVLAFEGLSSIGWGDRYLYDTTETPVLDWNSRSLLGVWSSDSDPVSGNDLVRLSYLSGGYYPLSNPSGFATGIDSSLFVLKSESGEFYPRSNPSGFITGFNSGIYVTGQVVRPNETGDFISRFQTGQFYASNNPSGFITGVDTSNFVLKSETGSFVLTSQTGQLTGSFYPLNQNPSGYVTGSVVRPSETGAFITSSQTGQFYPMSNPSGFATGVDVSNLVLKSETGAYTGAFYPRQTNPSGYVTGSVVRPDTKYLYDSSSGLSIDWESRTLRNTDSSIRFLWDVGLLYTKAGLSGAVIELDDLHLVDSFGTHSVSWDGRILADSNGYGAVFWQNRLLMGSGWSLDTEPTGGAHVATCNFVTGYSYPLLGNPSGYVTGSVVRPTETGQFVTTSQTGLFYPASNPSGFATGIDASNLVTKSETGAYTGTFYPLASNPSGYLTGQVVRPSDTGNFITSSQTGQFYPMSNPSGFATGVDVSNLVLKSETGAYTGFFYPLGANPSGYVTGNVVRPTETGAFLTTLPNDIVRTTGDQNISGDKHFYDTWGIQAIDIGGRYIMNENGVVYVNVNLGQLHTIYQPNSGASFSWLYGQCYDTSGREAISWMTRQLNGSGGWSDINLDWQENILSGNWSSDGVASQPYHIVNYSSLTGYAYPRELNPSGFVTGSVVRPTETGSFLVAIPSDVVRTTGNQSISGRKKFLEPLVDFSGTFSLDPNGRYLYDYFGNASQDWSERMLYALDTSLSLSYQDRALYDASDIPRLEWASSNLLGVWSHTGIPSADSHLVNYGYLTGFSYPLASNPAGYVTGSVVRPSETGSFITSSQTGQFYPISNPSGFATGIDASNFVLKSETGAYTGIFYPFASNPANYVTGNVVRPTETGGFASLSYVDGLSRVSSVSSLTGSVLITGADSIVTSISGQTVIISGTSSQSVSATQIGSISVYARSDVGTLETGLISSTICPFDIDISGWLLTSDVSGNISCFISGSSFTNYPSFSQYSSGDVSLANQIRNSGVCSGWNTTLNKGDVIQIGISGISGISSINFIITGQRR